MKYKFYENKDIKYYDILKSMFTKNDSYIEKIYNEIIYTGTARSALSIILDFLKIENIITNKNSEILVPQWMCTSLYQSMHKKIFPTLTPSKNTRGVMVYHQYGFPQDMDVIMDIAEQRNWFVIENCSNVYESYYKGRKLGSFGLATIFSFSKMFASILGGALFTKNKDLIDLAKEKLKTENNFILSRLAHVSRIFSSKDSYNFWNQIQEMAYNRIDTMGKISNISHKIINRELKNGAMQQRQKNGAMQQRQKNYHLLLEMFKDYDYFEGLEIQVVPYVVPLIAKEKQLEVIKNKLRSSNIFTDIYHFDVNRNLLNPNFKKCIWIPVHQGISESKMLWICNLISNAI